MSEIGRCETCRFWDNSTQHGNAQPDTTGLCRRKAPEHNIYGWNNGMGIWPFTEDTDWCGEYEQDPDKVETEF